MKDEKEAERQVSTAPVDADLFSDDIAATDGSNSCEAGRKGRERAIPKDGREDAQEAR